jgi:hypothetical protein
MASRFAAAEAPFLSSDRKVSFISRGIRMPSTALIFSKPVRPMTRLLDFGRSGLLIFPDMPEPYHGRARAERDPAEAGAALGGQRAGCVWSGMPVTAVVDAAVQMAGDDAGDRVGEMAGWRDAHRRAAQGKAFRARNYILQIALQMGCSPPGEPL